MVSPTRARGLREASGFWKMYWISRLCSALRWFTRGARALPSSTTEPAAGGTNPLIARAIVDLPLPVFPHQCEDLAPADREGRVAHCAEDPRPAAVVNVEPVHHQQRRLAPGSGNGGTSIGSGGSGAIACQRQQATPLSGPVGSVCCGSVKQRASQNRNAG